MFDANIIISYLLSPNAAHGSISQLFLLVYQSDVELILPVQVLAEVADKIASRPALASRISSRDAERILEELRSIATIVPVRDAETRRVVRDPDDDYLIAYAVEEQVDVLVSGDKDILALAPFVAQFTILAPRRFLDEFIARNEGAID